MIIIICSGKAGGKEKKGRPVYFEKKRVAKERALLEKFETLHASGGLDRFLSKKRKQNSQTDRKRLHKGGVAQ
jgi:hypothetical protein